MKMKLFNRINYLNSLRAEGAEQPFSYRTEILGGITTFLSISYIFFVNPLILSKAGFPFEALLTGTVLVVVFGSLVCGLFARSPYALAPGLGLNSLFAILAVSDGGAVPWQVLFGCLFYAGIFFAFLVFMDGKYRFLDAIPSTLRIAFGAGIGLLIVIIGLGNSGLLLVGGDAGYALANKMSASLWTFLIILVIALFLAVRNIRGGFILAIIIAVVLSWPLGRWWGGEEIVVANSGVSWPDFSLLGNLSWDVILQMERWPLILLFAGTMFFDCYGSVTAVAEAGNLLDKKKRVMFLHRNLLSAAVTAMFAGAVGSSPPAIYIESATGVRAGARTGIAAITVGLLALPCLFLAPLLQLIPAMALAPILIIVGVFVLKPLIYVRWEKLDEVLPVVLCMFVIPLTHSIMMGMVCGIISWTVMKVLVGKYRKIPGVMYFLSIVALLLYVAFNSGLKGQL